MCDVTAENFEEIYPLLEHQLLASNFVAFDAEFTGLSPDGLTRTSLFDNGQQRYQTLYRCATTSIIHQIGLSFFTNHPESNTYSVNTYNFYICPRSFAHVDARFLCQASSLEFLASHGFDFNKFVYSGISYLTHDDERELRQLLKNGSLFSGIDRDIEFQAEDIIRDVTSQLTSWNPTNRKCGDVFETKYTKMSIAGCYVLHRGIRSRFKNMWTFYQSNEETFVAKLVSKEEREQLESEYQMEDLVVTQLVGFSRVIRKLIDAKKPIVGHNCFLDVLKIVHQFYNPLPKSYEEFKGLMTSLFPRIYDTKLIAFDLKPILENCGMDKQAEALDSTGLDKLTEKMAEDGSGLNLTYSPIVIPGPGGDKYNDVMKPHEAGYDAYVTGRIYLKLAHIAAAAVYLSIGNMRPLKFSEHEGCLRGFANQLNLSRASIPYINLSGPDPPTQRPALIVVSSKTKTIKPQEIADQLAGFGSAEVRPLSPTSVLVAVTSFRTSRDIFLAFKDDKSNLTVSRYNAFKHDSRLRRLLGVSGFATILFGCSAIAYVIATRK